MEDFFFFFFFSQFQLWRDPSPRCLRQFHHYRKTNQGNVGDEQEAGFYNANSHQSDDDTYRIYVKSQTQPQNSL